MEKPNPGSREAIEQGCTCPVLDNYHGKGWMGGVECEDGRTVFAINLNCKLHGSIWWRLHHTKRCVDGEEPLNRALMLF